MDEYPGALKVSVSARSHESSQSLRVLVVHIETQSTETLHQDLCPNVVPSTRTQN